MKGLLILVLMSFNLVAQIPTWYHDTKIYDYENIIEDKKDITDIVGKLEFKYKTRILIVTTTLGVPRDFNSSVSNIMAHNEFEKRGILIVISKSKSKIRLFLGDEFKVNPLDILYDASYYYNEDYQKIIKTLLLSLDVHLEMAKIVAQQKEEMIGNKQMKKNYTLLTLGIAVMIIVFIIALLMVMRKV